MPNPTGEFFTLPDWLKTAAVGAAILSFLD